MTLTVELTDAEYARLRELAAASGLDPAAALKDRAALAPPAAPESAVSEPAGSALPADDPYPHPPPHPPEQAHLFADWASWPLRKRRRFQACGIWRDRGDLDLIDDRSGRDRTERVWWQAVSSRTPEGVKDMAERCPGSFCPPDLPLFDEAGNVIPGTGTGDGEAGTT